MNQFYKFSVIARRAKPDVAISSLDAEFGNLWEIATPVCALVRNDMRFRRFL